MQKLHFYKLLKPQILEASPESKTLQNTDVQFLLVILKQCSILNITRQSCDEEI
jgi:hypothetical protein